LFFGSIAMNIPMLFANRSYFIASLKLFIFYVFSISKVFNHYVGVF